MAYTNTWDETLPTGSEAANTLDDTVRAFKVDIDQRFVDIFAMPNFTADPLRPYGLKFADAQDAVINLGDNGGTPRSIIVKDKTSANTYLTINSVIFSITVPHTITTASANALVVGLAGATNPAFKVDASTAVSATGLQIKSAAAASGLALAVISSGVNENLTIDAKGSGTISLNATGTGAITLGRATTITTGGLTITAGGLTVSLNGAVITGNSTVTGTLATTGKSVVGAAAVDASYLSYVYATTASLGKWERNGGTAGTIGTLTLGLSNGIAGSTAADVLLDAASGAGILFRTNGATTALSLTVGQGAIFNGPVSGITTLTMSDYLTLGKAYVAGVTTATGTIAIKDSTGTIYNVLVHT